MPDKSYIGFNSIKASVLIVLFVVLETINIVYMESSINLILTIPQFLFVLYVLFVKRDIHFAFLLHVIFILTSLDATSGSTELQMLSYAKVKLVGPLTMSYIVLGFIWLRARSMPIICSANSLLLVVRKILLYLLLSGVIIGVPGLFLFSHRLEDFILPFIYTFVGYLYADIYVRLCEPNYLKKCTDYAFTLLLAAPFATFLTYFVLGVRAEYSTFEALIFNEVFMMAPMLLLFFFFKVKNIWWLILSVITYGICVGTAGRGGMFLNIIVALCFILYYIYFCKHLKHHLGVRILRAFIPIVVLYGLTYVGILEDEGGQSLAVNKINEVSSLIQAAFSLRSSSFVLTDVAASPFIRIAEVLNILDNGIKEPLSLVFGHGFGGVYTDSTHLFDNVDLSLDAFPPEVIKSGKFGTAHSFLPTTLLYNGLVGLFLIFLMGLKYIKECKKTPFVYAAYILCFYSFYFNTSLFIASTFTLFCAEYMLNPKIVKK